MAQSSSERIDQNISIIYFTIYALVFLIASIYSAYEVESKYHLIRTKNSNTSNTQKQLQLNVINNNKINHNQKPCKHNNYANMSCFKRTKKFVIYWVKSLWTKKSIYFSIIPHLFDQATDLGVVYKYYEIWKDPGQYENIHNTVNIKAIFFASIGIIILSKIISCGAIFVLTRKCTNVLLQFFDLMMVKAIYLNYKLDTNEPGNAQRYLQILEATFESAPQITISVLFILKTINTSNVDSIVLISTISSLWTLTSRVTSDDKTLLQKHWKSIEFDILQFPRICNVRYLFRVIFWRFFEITSRVFLLCIFWIVVGGFALTIIMTFELLCAIILCYFGEGVIILGNMMYFTASAVNAVPYSLLIIGKMYKLFSTFLYLMIITMFIFIKFEAPKVDDYSKRHIIIKEPLGFAQKASCGRNLLQMTAAGDWDEALNLIEFGANIAPLITIEFQNFNVFARLLEDIGDDRVNDEIKIYLFKLLFEFNPIKSNTLITATVHIKVEQSISDNTTCVNYACFKSLHLLKYMIEQLKKQDNYFNINRITDNAGRTCLNFEDRFNDVERDEIKRYLVDECQAEIGTINWDSNPMELISN
eukprot:216670_1